MCVADNKLYNMLVPGRSEAWSFRFTETTEAYYPQGSWGVKNFVSSTYSLHCHHQNDCIKGGSYMNHFNVSSIVWAKSQDTVHKPQVWKRKES